jgi:hypothetical protein
MTGFLSFLAAGCFYWAIVHHLFGCPGALHGPWPLERLMALKRGEYFSYWGAVVGIPLGTALIVYLVNRLLPLWARVQRPIVEYSVPAWGVLLPWLAVPLLLQTRPPSWMTLVILPGVATIGASALWAWYARAATGPSFNPSLSVAFPKDATENHFRRFSWISFFFFAVFLPLVLFFAIGDDPFSLPISAVDEGLRLAAAQQIEFGKHLYQNIFLNYGPLMEAVVPRAAFHLFGHTLAGLRIMEWWIHPLGLLAVYAFLLQNVRHRWLLIFFSLCFVGQLSFWITPRMAAPFVAFFCLIAGDSKNSKIPPAVWRVLCGLSLGVGFLYSAEAGILGLATVVAYDLCIAWNERHIPGFAARNFYKPIGLAAGLALSVGVFLAWLAAGGRLWAFFQDFYLASTSTPIVGGKPTPVLCAPLLDFLRHPFHLYTWEGASFRLWLPVLLYLAFLGYSACKISAAELREGQRSLLLATLSGVFFYVVALGRADFDHWLKATASFWVLRLLLLDRLWSFIFDAGVKRRAVKIAAAGAFLIIFSTTYAGTQWNLIKKRVLQFGHLPRPSTATIPGLEAFGPLRISEDEIETYREVSARLRRWAAPGQALFIFSNDALYYFLTGTLNPTPFSLECYILQPLAVSQTMEGLQANPPACILARGSATAMDYRDPVQKPIQQYIEGHYRLAERWKDYLFFTRVPPDLAVKRTKSS